MALEQDLEQRNISPRMYILFIAIYSLIYLQSQKLVTPAAHWQRSCFRVRRDKFNANWCLHVYVSTFRLMTLSSDHVGELPISQREKHFPEMDKAAPQSCQALSHSLLKHLKPLTEKIDDLSQNKPVGDFASIDLS